MIVNIIYNQENKTLKVIYDDGTEFNFNGKMAMDIYKFLTKE